MFKRILVPLDGSDLAEQAIPVAARIARNAGGVVILAQVAPIPVDFQAQEKNPAEIYDDNLIEQGEALAVNYLDHFSRMAELVGVATRTQALFGDVAPAILTAVESLGIDLIVMCSHGNTASKRWSLGSVTQKVARHSSVPVLVVHEGKQALSFAQQHDSEYPVAALVPLDGSSSSELVLEPTVEILAALATPGKAYLHLLEVVALPSPDGHLRGQTPFNAEIKAQEMHEAEAYLKSVKERLSQGPLAHLNLTITTSVMFDPDIAGAIVQIAGQDEQKEDQAAPTADFIAMATHGRGGLPRWIMGSITERVLHAATLPLLIVSPHIKETQHVANSAEIREEIVVEEAFEMSQD